LENVDQLVGWGPYIEVKNTGDEVIDGIRVEVEFTVGALIGVGVTQKWPIPYAVTQASTLEPPWNGKLLPGHTATILIVKPLLEQILKARMDDVPNGEYIGDFHVRVLCRMTGGAGYDRPEPQKTATLHFAWLPSGFPDQQCKKILEVQPRVHVDD
jgi:hypothetical protein